MAVVESRQAEKIPNVPKIGVEFRLKSNNKKTAYIFDNLLNILIDRHLKLLYFKVPNRPTQAWYTIQVLPLRSSRAGDWI